MNTAGFVVGGRREPGPEGMQIETWLDRPELRLRMGEDGRARAAGTWIRSVVLHTTKGLPGSNDEPPQQILPGLGDPVDAGQRVARYWSRDGRQAGAHLIVDFDGRVSQTADLRDEMTWHCPGHNTSSIGVEIYQGSNAELYEGQLDVVVRLCDWITKKFRIQRQIPFRYLDGPVPRFLVTKDSPNPASDVVGVIGHRDAAKNRGPGDPGSAVFYRLGRAGYEPFDFSVYEDRETWRRRQRDLGIADPDGIPGPATCEALVANGFETGLWVRRPGDDA